MLSKAIFVSVGDRASEKHLYITMMIDDTQKEELELESLKTKILNTANPAGMKESAVVPVLKTSLVAASSAAVNAEIAKKAKVPAKAPGKKNSVSSPPCGFYVCRR